jgi:F0F1-type ATP synthase epsilon subunit
MIAATGDGELRYTKDNQDQTVFVKSGILSLEENQVRIFTTR